MDQETLLLKLMWILIQRNGGELFFPAQEIIDKASSFEGDRFIAVWDQNRNGLSCTVMTAKDGNHLDC